MTVNRWGIVTSSLDVGQRVLYNQYLDSEIHDQYNRLCSGRILEKSKIGFAVEDEMMPLTAAYQCNGYYHKWIYADQVREILYQ